MLPFLLLLSLVVRTQPGPAPSPGVSGEQELLARYLLSRLLDTRQPQTAARRQDREDQDPSPSIVYPQVSHQSITQPLRRLLQKAKENIEVIDFRKPPLKAGLQLGSPVVAERRAGRVESGAAAQAIPTFLPFPGTEPGPARQLGCGAAGCGEEGPAASRFSMPLTQLGHKKYYLGIFFKANWYKAEQYCRFHGMHLASINSAEEQRNLEEHIQSFGMGHEHFWTSGTDQAEEGKFFWMSTGKPMTYENWNAGEPNNFQYENGEQEHCLELWNRDGKGLRWNDTPCSFETFFVCEV